MASFLPKHPYPTMRYESSKKINGNTSGGSGGTSGTSGGGPQASPPQMTMKNSHVRSGTQSASAAASDMNGIGISDVLASASTSGTSGSGGFSGMYNDTSEGLDNYLGSVASGGPMSNGMYGQHELVAAISQITADPAQQQNKAFNKAKKLWSEAGGPSKSENESKGPRGFRPPTAGTRPTPPTSVSQSGRSLVLFG